MFPRLLRFGGTHRHQSMPRRDLTPWPSSTGSTSTYHKCPHRFIEIRCVMISIHASYLWISLLESWPSDLTEVLVILLLLRKQILTNNSKIDHTRPPDDFLHLSDSIVVSHCRTPSSLCVKPVWVSWSKYLKKKKIKSTLFRWYSSWYKSA
jgi:hypothetical protein